MNQQQTLVEIIQELEKQKVLLELLPGGVGSLNRIDIGKLSRLKQLSYVLKKNHLWHENPTGKFPKCCICKSDFIAPVLERATYEVYDQDILPEEGMSIFAFDANTNEFVGLAFLSLTNDIEDKIRTLGSPYKKWVELSLICSTRKGLGSLLMKLALSAAQYVWGPEIQFYLKVAKGRANEAAIHVYKKFGFIEVDPQNEQDMIKV